MLSKPLVLLALLLSLCLLVGCAVGGGSKLVRTELQTGFQATPLKRVMVVGIFENRDRRINFENEFVQQFRAHGATAFTSLAVLPQDKERDKAEILRQAKAQKAQAIFVGFLLTTDSKTASTPGYSQSFYRPAWGFGGIGLDKPGYGQMNQKVRIVTQLYDLKNKEPYWTAETLVISPKSVGEILDALTKEVMSDLKAKGLIN